MSSISGDATRVGFTRTELLFGLGSTVLLVLLALVLLPRAKEYRCREACQNNLTKIGVAMAQYAQGHENRYPRDWMNNPGALESEEDDASPTGAWCKQGFDAVLPVRRELFVCPGDVWLNRNLSTWGRRNKWDDTSYGMNTLVQHKQVSSVANPAGTILLGHTRFEHTLWEDNRSVLWDTHHNGNNYLFCDGHVQFLSGPETLSPKSLWIPGKVR